ncbi:unnamed protein product [Cunninghamella blakesleeana]
MYNYDAQQEEELTIKEDEILVLYENNYPDWYLVKARNGDIGLAPSNYVETISEEQTTSHDTTNINGSNTINTTTNTISTAKQNTDDEALSWSVHEYDTDKKKKKKSKGNLLIGNGLLCYGSETDKSIPVQQFSILDVKNYNLDGKNIHISLNNTVFDFQSSSKSEAKAIINKLDESLSLANAHQTSSLPSTTVQENHINETTSLPTTTPSINAQPEYDHHISEPEPESVPEPEQPVCEPRWSIVLYSFEGQEEGELTVNEEDQVLAIDYVSSEDWWTVELQDGRTGIIPATYVKFQEDYEADLAAEAEAEAEALKQQELANKQKQIEMEKAEKQRQLEFEAAEKERQRQLEEAEKKRQLDQQQQQLEKERERQLEAERRRKMQEEAKQREIDAKRAATRAVVTNSPQISSAAVASSPRRSQIPAPPPPTVKSSPSPRHVTPPDHHQQQQQSTNDRLKPTHDTGKPDPSKVRTWTDRTGAFKVDAQLLACNNGKIRLHKVNGVKIDVPVHKMCVEDLRYIEQETGAKLIEDKNDNIPLAHLTSSPSSSNNNNNKTDGINWFDFFTKLNIPSKNGLHYAAAFQQEGLGEKDLEYLTHKRMKNLGMTERHIRRLQKYVEAQEIDPPSDGEAVHRENNTPIFGNKKTKKTVTFGSTSIIHDEEDGDNMDETIRKQKQIEEDERLARQLQQQENEGRSGSTTLHRRGTARPVPTNSAPRDMNSQIMDKIKSQLSTEPLQPSNTGTVNNTQPSQFSNPSTTITSTASPSTSSPSLSFTNANQSSGFKDDAWATRTIENKSPNLQAQQPLQSSSPQTPSATAITGTTSTTTTLSPEQKIQQQIEQIQQYQQQQKEKQLLDHQRAEQQQLQQQLEQQKQQLLLQQQQLQQQQQQIQLQQQQQMNVQQQQQMNVQQQQQMNVQPQQINLQQQPQLQQPVSLPPRQRPTPQVSQVNRVDSQLLNQWTSNNQSSSPQLQQTSPAMQNMMHTGAIQPNLPPRSPNQFAQQLPQQQNQFSTPVFSQNQPSPMLQVNLQPQMTGYPSPIPLQPTAAPLKPQATGRNWATATPDNPFGSGAQAVSQSPSPNMTQYSNNIQSSLQPAQVFAQMTGSPAANIQQPALTGFNSQQQLTNPNDPYSVFKSMNPQGPSVFNPQQQQMAQFQQPQQTGFMQQQQPFQGGRW